MTASRAKPCWRGLVWEPASVLAGTKQSISDSEASDANNDIELIRHTPRAEGIEDARPVILVRVSPKVSGVGDKRRDVERECSKSSS